ncbi:MAG: hypothetical protein GXX90_03545 [Microbacteriaceae bacterium]|nr:hypothetical protein [Microbacteriaceae bacterium]
MLLALWTVIAPALAAVLGAAALSKARDPQAVDRSFADLDVPAALSHRWMRRVFPWAELALAVLLVASWGPASVLAAALALVLLLAYLALVARALAKPEPVPCGCFGESDDRPVDRATLVRNLVLVAVAALGLLAVAIEPAARAAAWPLLAAERLPVVAGTAVAAAVLVALARNGDLRPASARPRPASAPAVAPPAVGATAGAPATTSDEASDEASDDGPLDYVRTPIPAGALRMPDGSIIGLRQLARRAPLLLIHASTGCGACSIVLDDLDRLRRLAAPIEVLVVTPPTDAPVGELGHAAALGDGLGVLFGMSGVPWAAILGLDGLLAGGPVIGPDAILAMAEELRAELDAAGLTADRPDDGRAGDPALIE